MEWFKMVKDQILIGHIRVTEKKKFLDGAENANFVDIKNILKNWKLKLLNQTQYQNFKNMIITVEHKGTKIVVDENSLEKDRNTTLKYSDQASYVQKTIITMANTVIQLLKEDGVAL